MELKRNKQMKGKVNENRKDTNGMEQTKEQSKDDGDDDDDDDCGSPVQVTDGSLPEKQEEDEEQAGKQAEEAEDEFESNSST